MQQGYIKLHRKIKEWALYDDEKSLKLFIHLLLSVTHKEMKYKGVILKAGQYVASVRQLSVETNLTENEIRARLKKLKKDGAIYIKSTNKSTLITIANWELYQICENNAQTTAQTTTQTTAQTTAHKKHELIEQECKQEVRSKNNNPPIVPPKGGKAEGEKVGAAKATSKAKKEITVEELENLTQGFKGELYIKIHDFVAFRREIGKPMTLRAVKLFLKHLHELSEANGEKGIAIIEQSMRNGWQDIYQLKDRKREEKRKVSFADIV